MQARLIIVFLILAFFLGLSGYVYYGIQKKQLTNTVQNELSSIADLKVNQITAWRNERVADATIMETNPVFSTLVRHFLQNPGADGARRDILAWLNTLLKNPHYKSIALVDPQGRIKLATSPDVKVSGAQAKNLVQRALRDGKSFLSDFHQSPVFPHPHLGLVAPLKIQKGKESVFIGALIFRIEPQTFLYPLIQSWPVASNSAETMLVRNDGDSVLFLNELRHKKDTALSFRINLDKTRSTNMQALHQERGMFEGLDYRKAPVLGATRHVPQTPWVLIAKIDVDEVFAPLRMQARLLSFVFFVLTAGAGLVLLFWLRRKTAEDRERYFQSELARQTLSRQYDLLSRYSNDIILLMDTAGNIRDANDRALQAYGYSLEELLRLSVWDLRLPETRPDIKSQMEQIREHSGLIFETVHKRKDGSTFPVEISSRLVDDGNEGFFQSVIRDITERKQAEAALINERNRSQAIIAAIGDGISIQDLHLKILYQNQIHRDMTGDHIGEYCYQAYEHHSETCEGCALAASFKDGMIHTAERSVQTDRGMMHVEITSYPLRDESGGIVAGIEVVRNITGRKEAANQLRRERDRNQLYLDLVGGVLVALNKEQKIILINKKGCALLGHDEQELIGRNWFDIAIPPAVREEIRSVYSRMMSGVMRQVKFYENEIMVKDGSRRTIAWHNSTLLDDAKNIIGTLSSGEDITLRKKAELALSESEKRYRRLIESVTDCIYSANVENGRVVRINHGPGCVSVTGYTAEEYLADPDLWDRMIFDADRASVIDQTNNILLGAPITPFEYRIIHKDGSLRWIRNTSVPHYNAEGRLAYYDGLIADITQLKTLENQLRQAQKMEAVGQLAGGVAHDFNNILTAIIGYAHLLLMKIPENDPARPFLGPILVSAERAAHLTSSLLAFSRKQVPHLQRVDINTILRRVEHLLGRVIGENYEFKAQLEADSLMVLADSVQIEQVLMNLATNARDSMPNGGILLWKTKALTLGEDFIRTHSYGSPGRYVCLSVTDTGVGMDENTLTKIFEPFFTTKEVGKGTGLGLSMVYGIMKQHHGFIDVSSEPGKGSTFKLYFPLLAAGAAVEQSASAPDMIENRGTETVLVAEDDKSVRDLTRFVLEGHGYTVIEAIDGVDAVWKFVHSDRSIDLLILDLIMPRKSGKEAYQEIMDIRPDIKVIFMSGYTADVAHKHGILAAGHAMILKPITPSDLLKKVREVLDGK